MFPKPNKRLPRERIKQIHGLYLSGMTKTEIAKKLGLPKNWAGKLVERAKRIKWP